MYIKDASNGLQTINISIKTCLIAVTKYLTKETQENQALFWLKFEVNNGFTIVRKPWLQQCEAAGHIVSLARKKRVVDVIVQVTFSFHSF